MCQIAQETSNEGAQQAGKMELKEGRDKVASDNDQAMTALEAKRLFLKKCSNMTPREIEELRRKAVEIRTRRFSSF